MLIMPLKHLYAVTLSNVPIFASISEELAFISSTDLIFVLGKMAGCTWVCGFCRSVSPWDCEEFTVLDGVV